MAGASELSIPASARRNAPGSAGIAAAAEPVARRLHEADPKALDPVLLPHRALAGSGRAEEAATLAITRYRADPCRVGLLESHLRHLAATGRRDAAAALLERELQGEAGTTRPAALHNMADRLGLCATADRMPGQ